MSMEYEKKLRDRIVGENKDWSYELIQREIPEKGKAYLIIRRCAERDFDRLLLRVTHQAMRNGARQVYVCDLEGGRKEEYPEGRIAEGKAYGYYTFRHACDVIAMEKAISAAGGVLADGNGSAAVLADRNGSETVLADGNGSVTAPENGKSPAASPADLRLEPVTGADVFGFSALANGIFRSVPGFVSVTDAETAEQISISAKELFFLRADERNAGLLQLAVCGDSLEVERIGVAENDRRKGLALEALAAAERIAAGRGCKQLRLAVLAADKPAIALFEKFGFGQGKIVSRWYSWSDERV